MDMLEYLFIMLLLKYRHLLDKDEDGEYVLKNYDGLDYQQPRPHLYLVRKD